MNAPTFLPRAFVQNRFVDFEDAKISVATHALQYGTAAFGGLRCSPNPQVSGQYLMFRLSDHCTRLSNSAKFLEYSLSAKHIEDTIIEFIRQNAPHTSFYIRPLAYVSDLNISPRVDGIKKDFLVYGLELGDYLSPDGVSVCFSSWQRQSDISFPLRGKITGAYITSSLAKSEAVARGFDDALMMNSQGKVSEGSGMNVFMVRDGVIYTPGVDQDILEGITRRSVIEVAKDMGYTVIERPIDKTELLIADEVFLTGTAAKVAPVKAIENYTLPDKKPVTTELQNMMNKITKGEVPQYEHWVTRVSE